MGARTLCACAYLGEGGGLVGGDGDLQCNMREVSVRGDHTRGADEWVVMIIEMPDNDKMRPAGGAQRVRVLACVCVSFLHAQLQ